MTTLLQNKSPHMANISYSLFKSQTPHVENSRNLLFQDLHTLSPVMCELAHSLLDERKNSSPTPLFGELVPWLLHDVCETDYHTATRISAGWLAFYIYICVLDNDADEALAPDPARSLTGMLLITYGMRRFLDELPTDNAKNQLLRHLSYSIDSQYSDILSHRQHFSLTEKKHFSRGKNYGLMALAEIFSNTSPRGAVLAKPFVERLLLPIQYLDDITDWREDYAHNTPTVLLTRALGQEFPAKHSGQLQSREVFANIIQTGALKDTLNEAVVELRSAMALMPIADEQVKHPTYIYIKELISEIENLTVLLSKFNSSAHTQKTPISDDYIDYIAKRLKIIAQSS